MMRTTPAVAVVIVLATFAWHPAGLPQAFAQQDKLAHLLGFAALSLSLRLGLPNLSRQEYAGALLLAASAMELGQTFLPARTGSLGDIAADAVGALLGFALADAWQQWRSPIVPAVTATGVLDGRENADDPHARADHPHVANDDGHRFDPAIAPMQKEVRR